MASRGIEVAHATTPYAALAELCRGPRTTSGPHRAAPRSLVLVEPGTLGREAEVVRAASRYAPGAVIWAFQARPAPTLRAVSEADLRAWERHLSEVPDSHDPPWTHTHRNGTRSRAGLRLTDDPPVAPASADPAATDGRAGTPEASDDQPGPVRHILTQEELEMLLADGEPDAGRGP